jgi:hypothetical protein
MKILPISALCSVLPERGTTEILSLAAATAAARAIIIATAIVAYDLQFKHGFHLLSNRRMSIDSGKKIGGQQARALQPYLLMTFTNFSVVTLSGANLIMIWPQHTAMFSWFSV